MGRRPLLAALLCVAAMTSPAPAAGTIDLDAPGALEALARANPAHHTKVRHVSYVPVVLTSHPAKRRLSFALDDTRYEAVVVLTGLRGDIVPLR